MSQLPDRLGDRFVLGPLIGRGTCSQVHRAHDLLLDRAAAVKIFPVADDPRVEREVSLLASLDHPSLVGVYDVGQVHGRAFVVMALFEGGSLADRLRHGPLALGETILAVSSVADALAHVHRAGVLHRDVTPRNILFDADGRAHLSDFGVAFVADSPRITDTGIVVGSAPYLAPEQVRGDEVGPPADVYSLALAMIEALTARPAYSGTPLEAAVARLAQLPRIPEGLGDDVTDLLVEMTADDPAERPDAESVRLRLRRAALAREVGTPSGRQPVVPAPRAADFEPARLPTRALMVVGAAAMSVLLAGTVIVASTWTVRDVSASSNPPASLSPSASTPLGATLGQAPAPAPVSAGSDGSRSRSSQSDRDESTGSTEAAGRFWRAVAGSSGHSTALPTRSPSGAPVARTSPRRDADSSPRLATPPSSSSGSTDEPTDKPVVGDPRDDLGSSPDTPEGSDGPEGRVLPELPGVAGDVTRNLPAPLGRSSSGSDDDTPRSATSESSSSTTTTTTPARSVGKATTTPTTTPKSTTRSSTSTTSTTRKPVGQALGALLGP